MHDGDRPAEIYEVADYVIDITGELAAMARRAGLAQTETALLLAQRAALAELRRLQPGKAAPDDAA
mgnify:CR=1 FL=1